MAKAIFAIRQWAIRSVHSNGICQLAFQAWSFVKVFFRRIGRFFTGPKRGNSKAAVASDTPPGQHQRYQREFSKLAGWFESEAAAMWDCLLGFQERCDDRGHMLEIGVWKGKSAACSSLHAREDETCVFVDRMILPEVKDTLGTIRKSNNRFIQALSAELRDRPQLIQLGSNFRWIHIDGEHSGQAVRQDLELAHELLNDQGIICVDDFPSTAYPQINFAVIEYLVHHPDLVLLASGHNKCYICRQASAVKYLTYIRDELGQHFTERGASVTIWKSGRPADCNCFGITDRVAGYDYRGPDWDPGHIEI